MLKYISKFPESIIKIDESDFEKAAMAIFEYQFKNNLIYNQYCMSLGKTPDYVSSIESIPFLPIEFYKNHEVKSGVWKAEKIFESSGTTGGNTSSNQIKKLKDYFEISGSAFKLFYGNPSDYVILALVPSYVEQGNSSLISMIDHFLSFNPNSESGYFLYNHDELIALLIDLKEKGEKKVILMGVTYALLDLAEKVNMEFPDLIIMETGGMKGRRKELTRVEIHEALNLAFGTSTIHSEYGMTEMMSQAYSLGKGLFRTPPWVRVFTREINDPLSLEKQGALGVINWIDLGNLNTCSFIATSDLGRAYEDGSFEVLGRMDNSDIRGCNLMVVDDTDTVTD